MASYSKSKQYFFSSFFVVRPVSLSRVILLLPVFKLNQKPLLNRKSTPKTTIIQFDGMNKIQQI